MKLNIIYIKQIIFTLLLIILCQQNALSQEINLSTKKVPGLFWGFSGGPSQTKIVNSGSVYDSNLINNKQNSFFGTAEIGYFFSDYFGLSTGIGYISFKTKLAIKSFQKKFTAVDSENETFEMRVSGSGIQELQTVDFLSFPFCIHLRLPFNQSFGLFLKAGLNLSVPINKKYSSSGTLTSKGFYPAYNVLLEDLPKYGFFNDSIIVSKGELETKMMRFNALASVGFDVNITNKIQFAVAANFSNSLLKESYSSSQVNTTPDNLQFASNTIRINSFMGGSSKATAQSLGLEVTLRFFVK